MSTTSIIDNYSAWISIGVTSLLIISEILPFIKSQDYNGILHYFAVLAERIRIRREQQRLAAAQAAAEEGRQPVSDTIEMFPLE